MTRVVRIRAGQPAPTIAQLRESFDGLKSSPGFRAIADEITATHREMIRRLKDGSP